MVTATEAADELGITRYAVLKRIASGHFPGAVRATRRLWLIPREDVARAKATGRLKPGPKRRESAE
jgi:excisionase family DNA binding protein